MKKILWVLVALSVGFSSVLFYNPLANKAQAADYVQLKKKKKKTNHNYRSLTTTTVSGDDTNSDASVLYNTLSYYPTYYYRKIPVAGLTLANPFPLRIEHNITPVSGFEEEHWGGVSNYFITEGNVWVNYGYKVTSIPIPTTSFLSVGGYRTFVYNGGTRKKPTKRQAIRVYSFSVSGDESNADTTAISPANPFAYNYFYRKISIPGLRVANLGDFRLMQKNPYYQGVNEEHWAPVNASYYFITDDYLYVAYGNNFLNLPYTLLYNPALASGDYRFYLYSDGKKKKKKLTKQYIKRYTFNVPGGESIADKTALVAPNAPPNYNFYYKRISLPGLSMADHYNMKVMKKNNFTSGFSGESWSEGSFYTTDGALWINYGTKQGTAPYTDTGAGDYQVFLYK